MSYNLPQENHIDRCVGGILVRKRARMKKAHSRTGGEGRRQGPEDMDKEGVEVSL